MKLQECKGKSRSIELEKSRVNIGRDEGNDLVLDDATVSGFHACIFNDYDKVEVVDLGSSNGTWVNGSRIAGRVSLKPWDKVRCGEVEFEITDPAGRRPTMVQSAFSDKVSDHPQSSVSAALATLRATDPKTTPSTINITGPIRVGRSEANDLILHQSTISSRHAEILVNGNIIEIVDLASTNGTWVNNKKINRQQLQDGDHVRFDEVEYIFSNQDIAKSRRKIDAQAKFTPGNTVVNPTAEPPRQTPAKLAVPIVPESDKPKQQPKPQPELPLNGTATVTGEAVSSNVPPPAAAPSAPPSAKPELDIHRTNTSSKRKGLGWLLFSFDGRISRKKFFLSTLTIWVLSMCISFLLQLAIIGAVVIFNPSSAQYDTAAIINSVVGILFFWPSLALTVKRFHDQNRSGHWYWLLLIPLVNIGIIIMLLFVSGTKGENRFGDISS